MDSLNVSYFNIIRKNYIDDSNKLYYEYDKYNKINVYEINEITVEQFSNINDCLNFLEQIKKKTTDEINEHIEKHKFNIDTINSYVYDYNEGNSSNIEVKFPKNDIGLYENSYVDYTINKFYDKF